MPHPDWESLSDFFDPAEFATAAEFKRGGEKIGEAFGIFDDPNNRAALGEYMLDHPEPRFTCAEADVALVRCGDVVAIEGRDFDLLQEPEKDGTGIAVLILARPNVIYNAGL